jgi:hypothetical protein
MLSVCAELSPPLETQCAVCEAPPPSTRVIESTTIIGGVVGGCATESAMFWSTMDSTLFGDCALTSQVAPDTYFVRPATSGGLMADADVSGTIVVTTELANLALAVPVEKGGSC